MAKESGFVTCVIIPYIVDEKVEGVLEFFALEEWAPIP